MPWTTRSWACSTSASATTSASGARQADPILYDSKDLVTHAVCVGMTGSGKTGLGIGLIEEAAIDGIPVLAIDPKGDLANLLLTFPNLAPSDFRPWVDPSDAAARGLTPDSSPRNRPSTWAKGLAEWDQDRRTASRAFKRAAAVRVLHARQPHRHAAGAAAVAAGRRQRDRRGRARACHQHGGEPAGAGGLRRTGPARPRADVRRRPS